MFPSRYFAARFFAQRYWPDNGAAASADGNFFCATPSVRGYFRARATVSEC